MMEKELVVNNFEVLGLAISPWIFIPLIYFIWVSLLLTLKGISFHIIRRWSRKTATKLDDIFIRAANFPITLLVFTSGGAVIEKFLPLVSNMELTNHFVIILKAVTIVASIIFADKFLSLLIKQYAYRVEILRTSGGIAQAFARVVVIGLGFLVLLDSFGVSVTPLIASLGIGSLAVALALQPTLENLFSGIQIITDKPIQLNQYIRLESGEEGYVYRIGWRATWILMPPNNVVVIPNKLLVNSRVINYHYPEPEMAVPVEIGVHYNSDLDHVERVTLAVAREVLQDVPGAIKDFEPVIRYHQFADFSVNFTAVLRAKEFSEVPKIRHEFIKRLHRRYAQEGIVIPYPIEAVNYSQEKAFEEGRK